MAIGRVMPAFVMGTLLSCIVYHTGYITHCSLYIVH
ncbi:hypothetical protein FAES_4620 [Fibrella aestuarina BUZ 2]|uniref:Uncharacterized protein n=1 Tax=Fibrella aestuarina BUZ 2 TaxID=1166018 RepID=I0KER6_9BACT|nr:hypothetical protein FAES_4620 [Fibrella aestuarina BUZ 2]